MKETNDIYDDEIRIIKREQPKTEEKKRFPQWLIVVLTVVILLLLCGVLILLSLDPKADTATQLVEQDMTEEIETVFDPVDVSENLPLPTWLGDYPDTTAVGYTQRIDTLLGQVALSIYIPYNAHPQLSIGQLDRKDGTIILAAQAADIRRDNKEIVGSFVIGGRKISEGISKTGYCRQYPLVYEGKLIENNPKNITKRKALCERQGQVFVVESQTNESFHSFAQALVDLGVNNAIYLVGSHSSYGWWEDQDHHRHYFCDSIKPRIYSNENYIVWKR